MLTVIAVIAALSCECSPLTKRCSTLFTVSVSRHTKLKQNPHSGFIVATCVSLTLCILGARVGLVPQLSCAKGT